MSIVAHSRDTAESSWNSKACHTMHHSLVLVQPRGHLVRKAKRTDNSYGSQKRARMRSNYELPVECSNPIANSALCFVFLALFVALPFFFEVSKAFPCRRLNDVASAGREGPTRRDRRR